MANNVNIFSYILAVKAITIKILKEIKIKEF